MLARRWVVSACAVALAAAAVGGRAAAEPPVPSLAPAATQAEWQQLVDRPQLRASTASAGCAPLRAVFYAATDWLRLATSLAADPSPCAQYLVSVPPLTADKSQPRADQAWRIRALGPSFHALSEINVTGWTAWVNANGGDWYAAGVEARRRMAAAGYDVAAGDTWALNELSSAVRQGTGYARASMRAFTHGLYDGDGGPAARGVAFVAGIGQSTADLSTYQARLQDWYADAPFWADMGAYVSDLSQEVYGDVRDYAAAGAPAAARRDALGQYLRHPAALAAVAPPDDAAAASFLAGAYSPLANAAWRYDSAFGWTDVLVELMEDYVSAQVYAARSAGDTRFGFAWSPRNADGIPQTDFVAQTGALLGRLAGAIADSASAPEDACGTEWCTGVLDGAALTGAWGAFATWRPSQLAFTSAPQTLAPGAASAPLTVTLETATGVPYTAGLPVAVALSSSSPTGELAVGPDGPWAPALEAQIASGASATSVYFRDSQPGAPAVAAAAAGRTGSLQTVTISAPPGETPPPQVDSTPAPVPAPAPAPAPAAPPAAADTAATPAPLAPPPAPAPTRSVALAAKPFTLAILRPRPVVLRARPTLKVTVTLGRAAPVSLALLDRKGRVLARWSRRPAAGRTTFALVLPVRARLAGTDRLRASAGGLTRVVPVTLRAR